VIAPDLPGFGRSQPVEEPTFARFADAVARLLVRLGVDSYHLYLHDFGAAVGLRIATRTPGAIRSLVVQNANAFETGMGPQWAATRAYWADPTPEREAEATAHLTLEGTRCQYTGGVPEDVAERIDPRFFELDEILSWLMALPRMEAHVLDGPHFLLETHAAECSALMHAFLSRVEGMR
jgi:pimeloyl-ACP methyl ester carboxylesterase